MIEALVAGERDPVVMGEFKGSTQNLGERTKVR
jgi:hypothetical protein